MRTRGRPRIHPAVEKDPNTPKRPPGRPKKERSDDDLTSRTPSPKKSAREEKKRAEEEKKRLDDERKL